MQPILTIDLSTGDISTFDVPRQWEVNFLGGASLAARLLYSELDAGLDPFSPAASLLFLTGPLTGTTGPVTGRFVVCGKSPATGLWAESNCGGFWGPELRFCGYDGLWIRGRSDRPVYLWLNDSKLEIRPAESVWGKDTYASQEIIKNEIGVKNCRVLTIGPAGENGILYSGLFCDHGRTAGRTGLGAVAGGKNLKAIAVKGTKIIPLYDPVEYAKLRSETNQALKRDNISQVSHAIGTAGVADYADYLGGMPKKYYHQGAMENVANISGSTMAETILTGTSACHGCVIACGRVVDLGDGVKRKGPEYETVVGFGPNLLNDDLSAIVRLAEFCDRQGMDTISASNVVGLAFHLYEMGILSEAEVGFPLRWGDTIAATRLLHLIVNKEGIGTWLSEGSRRFAGHYDVLDEAVQVNGLEVPYHDPRGVSGMALVYATSPRGACHNKSDYFFVDWGQADASLGLKLIDAHGGPEKAINVVRHQNWRSLCDALVMCFFGNVPIEDVSLLISAATGFDGGMDDYLRCGERGWTIKRVINHRMGLSRTNDSLPMALLEPQESGNGGGYTPPFQDMLLSYYTERGWDPDTGKPTKQTLRRLDMDDAISDIWK
jgi:aldehyde:ferredoxin oxidoreductase